MGGNSDECEEELPFSLLPRCVLGCRDATDAHWLPQRLGINVEQRTAETVRVFKELALITPTCFLSA